MELVIHGGCHKTATTWFQDFCQYHQSDLLERGIFYPSYKDKSQHSYLAWDMQRGDSDGLAELLRRGREAVGEDGVILLSGEDFENCLVDIYFAKEIERIASANGVGKVHWIFVERDKRSYLESLYSELSKHFMLADYYDMASIIKKTGYFCASSSDYSYIFVFDVKGFAARLSAEVAGVVEVIPFDDFRKGFPGRTVLDRFVSTDFLDEKYRGYPDKTAANTRISEFGVEQGYVQTFLRLSLRDRRLLVRLLAFTIVMPVSAFRALRVNRIRRAVKFD